MKPFTTIAIAVFTLVAIVHLLRLVFGWEVVVTGYVVPVWWSALGLIVAGGLAPDGVAKRAPHSAPTHRTGAAYFDRAPVSIRYRAMCRMASFGRASFSHSSARL